MKRSNEFLKKNKAFVLLLLVLLFITASLSTYIVMKDTMNNSQNPETKPNEPDDEISENAEISDFYGNYDRTSRQIVFRWDVEANKATISNVRLYYDENELLNVTPYSSYDLPSENYGIRTGDNEFTLEVEQSNGKKIKKTITVFVDYVVSMEQSVKQKENQTEITLTYQYEKANPVDEPVMILLDDKIAYSYLNYVGTTMSENGGVVTAKTTYRFTWSEFPVKYETFSVRWSFKDINDSGDFSLEKGVAPKDEKAE